MSSPSPRIPAAVARQAATCMCSTGRACSSFAPGHAVHLIQARLVAATPTEWVDAIVADADEASGEVSLESWSDGSSIELWNGAGAAIAVQAGDPVAYHPRHHVLAVGTRRFNALRLA